MKEEILRILKMVEEGKLSSEKAHDMISILQNRANEQSVAKKSKILKISVDSPDKDVVRVNVPLDFVKNMIKAVGPGYIQRMINQYAKNENTTSQGAENLSVGSIGVPEGIDINLILYAIENDLEGEIVNIESHGSRVYIVIE